MNKELLIVIIVSEVISLLLLFRVWKRQEYLFLKVLATVIVVIPIVGPIFYLFVSNTTESQPIHLQNNMPRGSYTQNLISQQASLEEAGKKQSSGDNNQNT